MPTSNPFDFSNDTLPERPTQPPPLPPRRMAKSKLNKKWVAILAGSLVGVVLLGCGSLGLIAVLGTKKQTTPESTTSGPSSAGKSANVGVKGIVIKHEPYTQVEMHEVSSNQTHAIDMEGKPKFKTFTATKPVPVKDITKVDFSQGPNGEPIHLAQYIQGKSLRQQAYFYLNKPGEQVLHGPCKQFSADGKNSVVLESVYVHGVEKCEYIAYNRPTQIDEYRGDGDHRRATMEYFANGGLDVVWRHKVIHDAGPKGETLKTVLHGMCVLYYDNALVMKLNQPENLGGVKKQELFENGVSVGFAVYDRSGKLVTSSGRLK